MKEIFYALCLVLSIGACTKTDFLDDEIVGERITLSNLQIVLKLGDKTVVKPEYFDQYGISKQAIFEFSTSDPAIAVVDANGSIVAKGAGQAVIQVFVGKFKGPDVLVNVVGEDTSKVASVTISSQSNQVLVNGSLQLNILVQNFKKETLVGKTVEWFSENSSILTVDSNGKITGVSEGVAAIHAKVDGVKSNSIDFEVRSSNLRRGTFVKAAGYEASGSTNLELNSGKLTLKLESNFSTSFALGTYIYLANSTNASAVRSAGLEISQISANGAHTFDVLAINNAVKLNTYKYVVILCKPATVTFGFAELK